MQRIFNGEHSNHDESDDDDDSFLFFASTLSRKVLRSDKHTASTGSTGTPFEL